MNQDNMLTMYFTVNRSPQELRDLWTWANGLCRRAAEHTQAYAFGVIATLNYLMDDNAVPPQTYKGKLSLPAIFGQTMPTDEAIAKCAGCPLWIRHNEKSASFPNPRPVYGGFTPDWIRGYENSEKIRPCGNEAAQDQNQ